MAEKTEMGLIRQSILFAVAALICCAPATAQRPQAIDVSKTDATVSTVEHVTIEGVELQSRTIDATTRTVALIKTTVSNPSAEAWRLIAIDGEQLAVWPPITLPELTTGVFVLSQPGKWGVRIKGFDGENDIPTEAVIVHIASDDEPAPPEPDPGNPPEPEPDPERDWSSVTDWVAQNKPNDNETARHLAMMFDRVAEKMVAENMTMDQARQAVSVARQDSLLNLTSLRTTWNPVLLGIDELVEPHPPADVQEYAALLNAVSKGLTK